MLVGDELVAEGGFISFEEGWTAKDAKVGEAGFSLVTVLVWCGWIAILVNDILGRADIYNVDCICMGMMEESAAKSCVVEKDVGGVMDFTPFGFADAVHFLVFRCGSFDFDTERSAFVDEFGRCECGASVCADEADGMGAAKKFCVSELLF